MQRGLPILKNLFRSVLLLSALTAASAQAAEKIDLIIDTDPGADDVVALLFAMASPDELNIRALTTVAGNVRLDKTSRNARLAREWAGREDIPVYAGAPAHCCARLSTPRTSTARKVFPASPYMNPKRVWLTAMPLIT